MKKRDPVSFGRTSLGKLLFLVFTTALVLTVSINTLAVELVDTSRKDCSIDLTLRYKSTDPKGNESWRTMNNGSISLFKVASASYSEGNEFFDTSAGKFTGYVNIKTIEKMTTEELGKQNAALGKALAAYTTTAGITADQVQSISGGKCNFPNLTPGLYLIYQTAYSSGRVRVAPFLMSIPDESGNYNITASPKPGVTALGTEEGDETEPHTQPPTQPPTTPPTQPTTEGGKLPQTGQLWWPIPVLALIGVLLIVAGLIRRRKNY